MKVKLSLIHIFILTFISKHYNQIFPSACSREGRRRSGGEAEESRGKGRRTREWNVKETRHEEKPPFE
jgi:hypothetical protein